MPISTWIQQCWHAFIPRGTEPTRLLLNASQEHYLWEQIITHDPESQFLLQLSETADLAQAAWGLLKQWQVDMHLSIFNSAEDYKALQRWMLAFQQTCHDARWIDAASLPDWVSDKIQRREITLPSQIFLVGFIELSPQLSTLLQRCEQAGTKVTHLSFSQKSAQSQRISFADDEEELLTMARWAKKTLSEQPQAMIGCVIPSLDKIRERVAQVFSEVFSEAHPYNISAGQSLRHYPIVYTALQLLSLYTKQVPIDVLGYLLMSPFLGEAESERLKRAELDRLLRHRNMTQISLEQLAGGDESHAIKHACKHFTKHLQHYLQRLEHSPKTQTYSEWAAAFHLLLHDFGWPGERSLRSDEYQTLEAWLQLLQEFSTFDHVAKPVSMTEALRTLNKLCITTVFQPKSPDAPIQVLGLLEAAALPFDAVWLSGMDDISWPPPPRPNPFIPKRLQRELKMPHATAERELTFCHALTEQFKQSASRVIFSHLTQQNELELQPSPLIREAAEITVDALQLPPYLSPYDTIHQSRKMQTLHDTQAPTLPSNQEVRGGR